MMHVVFGMLGIAAVLAATVFLEQSNGAFTGLFYKPALLLLGAGPLCVALISHKFEELAGCVRAVLRAVTFSPARSRATLHDELVRFASEVRRGRPAEALSAAEGASHDLLRQLAPLVVKQYSAAEIESTAATASYVLASTMKRNEDVLTSLARVAPATGLVGTTLGLISLLKDLRDFDQLGPSMALALLCTLYGLLLANALYQPLARLVHVHAVTSMEEGKLLTRALILVSAGKPLSDVRALFGVEGTAAAASADLAVG